MGKGGSRSSNDQRSDSMNHNNDEYWQSRGYDERSDDWEERAEKE